MAPVRTRPLAILMLALCVACSSSRSRTSAPVAYKRTHVISGFDLPESAVYDPGTDSYYVASMVGNPTAKDGNGYIARIDASDPKKAERFLFGGRDGVILNGPKGMVVTDGILWVVDIDTLRAFDPTTGKPVRTVSLREHGAAALNGIAVDDWGTLYVSDLRLVFADDGSSTHEGEDRIFRVTAGYQVGQVLQGNVLSQPNGLAWDSSAGRLLIAPLVGREILAWKPGTLAPVVAARSMGSFDGIEVLEDGSLLVSCLDDGSIHHVQGETSTPLIEGLVLPGDFGHDEGRGRLIIPLIEEGRVEIWERVR